MLPHRVGRRTVITLRGVQRIRSSDGAAADSSGLAAYDADVDAPDVDDADLIRLLVDIARTREFDRLAVKAARTGRLKGYYPCAGQESIVALAHALDEDDWVFPAYREQGLRLARGVGVAPEIAMFAGANAPWNPVEHRMMPANTAIGSHLPHAVGFARAQQLRGTDVVTVAVFGDGAVAEGDFHAAANLAGLWQPPVVLFCQNNQYAMSTPSTRQSGATSIAARGAGYGLHTVVVDGMDPLAVLAASREALRRARSGEGATLIESVCYRFGGHSAHEVRRRYRSRAEEARWRGRDPLPFMQDLVDRRGLGERASPKVEDALTLVREEFAAALESPVASTPSREKAEAWVGGWRESPAAAAHEGLDVSSYEGPGAAAAASAFALGELMARDERVVVIGEDVGDGGMLGADEGLAARFGDRVMDAPLNECGIVGAAIGMALAGMLPVAEIAFAGFALTAFDQLAFHAARYRWRSGGALSVPLVVRMPAGGGHGGYEGHNESIEGLLTHVPGLVVLAPATVRDTVAALITGVHSDAPVVILDSTRVWADAHAAMPAQRIDAWPIGRAIVEAAAAADVTIVTYGSALPVVREAMTVLARRSVVAELIDLRSLAPWDQEAVIASVRATSRLVVVHDSPRTGGLGGEVVASVIEAGVSLGAVPKRVAQADLPYGPTAWESLTALTSQQIVDAVLTMLDPEGATPVPR
jgi:2-oxoisovalerate dehydrogenase E1 component